MKKKVSETSNVTFAAPQNNTRTADVEVVARGSSNIIMGWIRLGDLPQANKFR